MTNSERRKRGIEMLEKVYAGDVVVPPEGNTFTDLIVEQLFAEVWSRDVLSVRDRRLLLATGIAVQAGVWSLMPAWYHLTFLVLLAPMVLTGGKLAASRTV